MSSGLEMVEAMAKVLEADLTNVRAEIEGMNTVISAFDTLITIAGDSPTQTSLKTLREKAAQHRSDLEAYLGRTEKMLAEFRQRRADLEAVNEAVNEVIRKVEAIRDPLRAAAEPELTPVPRAARSNYLH